MASKAAVVAALKLLGRAYAGVIDAAKVDVYHAALDDLTDADVQRAVAAVIKSHTGDFIPPPAVLRKAVAPAPVAVDADAILRRVEQLATYNAAAGTIYPSTATVEQQLGDAIGYAYASAGGPRVFSDNATTRDIARRDFQNALRDAVSRPDAALPVIGGRALPAGADPVRALITGVADSLRIDRGAA